MNGMFRNISTFVGLALVMLMCMATTFDTVGAAPLQLTQTVDCSIGTRTASTTDITLPVKTFSQQSQSNNGVLTLTAADNSCTGDGWAVTMLFNQMTYVGGGSASVLPAANLILGTPSAPTMVGGQRVLMTGGPFTGTGGTLDQPRRVMYAETDAGRGIYSVTVPLTFVLPPRMTAGVSTAVLTLTMSAGPIA